MPKPDEWDPEHHHVDPPTSDNDYFERMARVILASGLNWKVLEKKWPGIKAAFADFDIAAVAGFGERQVEQLMGNPDVIRNRGKIQGIIQNARETQAVVDEYGSFSNYLAALQGQGGEDTLRSILSKRFAYLGPGTTVIFLLYVGVDLPHATADWHNRHQSS